MSWVCVCVTVNLSFFFLIVILLLRCIYEFIMLNVNTFTLNSISIWSSPFKIAKVETQNHTNDILNYVFKIKNVLKQSFYSTLDVKRNNFQLQKTAIYGISIFVVVAKWWWFLWKFMGLQQKWELRMIAETFKLISWFVSI